MRIYIIPHPPPFTGTPALLEHDKSEALNLLNEQLLTEKKLVKMYEETSDLIMSEPAKWLLHILQMDSRKHIAIFDMAIAIMEGRRIGEEDRQEITVGLEKHLELERESIERSPEYKRYHCTHQSRSMVQEEGMEEMGAVMEAEAVEAGAEQSTQRSSPAQSTAINPPQRTLQ